MKIIKVMLATLGFVCLWSCATAREDYGVAHKRDAEYLRGRSVPRIQVSPMITIKRLHDDYPIPQDTTLSQPEKSVSLLPPGSLATEMIRKRLAKKNEKAVSPTVVKDHKTSHEISQGPDGNMILTLSENSEKAWGDLSNSLKRAGFLIVNYDKTLNTLFFRGDNVEPASSERITTVYQLHIYGNDAVTKVWLVNNDGSMVQPDFASKVFKRLTEAMAQTRIS